MVRQVLNIIADEKLYCEVRILACETIDGIIENSANTFETQTEKAILQTVENLLSSAQPGKRNLRSPRSCDRLSDFQRQHDYQRQTRG